MAFLEVEARERTADAYASQFGDGPLPFHFVWFTPRVDDEDPCEKFKSQFERMKKPGERRAGFERRCRG
ncbi:MAG: hypothetical protein HC869_13060 [Rhodospirillales bacterium]|nr:hypothetical protein [Rhodospirillales bacterium]